MNRIWIYWQSGPLTVVALVLLCLLYLRLWKFYLPKQAAAFAVAMILLVLCLCSPLQLLSAEYLFSVHMAMHVMLLLIIAPLLVLALPEQMPAALSSFFSFLTTRPWLAWFAGVGIMWFWHIPSVFNAMMRHGNGWHNAIHAAEIVSLILSGMIFSYPVIGGKQKLHPLGGIIYLSSACVFCSLLGLMVTFAPAGVYYHYLSANDVYGINAIVQNNWHISQADDQEAAGLIMWVPCCMIYVVACLYLLKGWFEEKDCAAIKTFTKKSTL